MRHPCRFGIARVVKIIGSQNWHPEIWFPLITSRTCIVDTDAIFNGSQNRGADSYNKCPIQTENLTVDPVGQSVEFILQIAVHIRETNELERCIVLVGCIFTG